MLVRVEGRKVETRPIAGRGRATTGVATTRSRAISWPTRRSGPSTSCSWTSDATTRRVCRFGTVQVAELMKVEHYSHVAHIVSSVVGELEEGRTRSTPSPHLPGGTLSGAPR